MGVKKQDFGEDEVLIFEDAIVYKRGDYWQFRLWLPPGGLSNVREILDPQIKQVDTQMAALRQRKRQSHIDLNDGTMRATVELAGWLIEL